jgi:hypothetical protein
MPLPDQHVIAPYFAHAMKGDGVVGAVGVGEVEDGRIVGVPGDLAQVGVQHLGGYAIPVADDAAALGELRIPADAREQFVYRLHA